jgi:hemin uptake protein HemP
MEARRGQTPQARPEPSAAALPCPPRRRIASTDLIQGAREIVILHHGEEYLLRITKSGKLILTK